MAAVIVAAVVSVLVLVCSPAVLSGDRKTKLVYATAGDANMPALMQNVIGPMFEQKHPDIELVTIHTGPGDAGSRTILEKIKAARAANKACWDIDVAVVHQVFMSWAILEGLLTKYADQAATWKYMTSEHAKVALGTNIEGYGIPLFHSQVAIAYNTKYLKASPKSYVEFVKWVEQNPSKFGYNGIKGGMSGVSFVIGWGLLENQLGWFKVKKGVKELGRLMTSGGEKIMVNGHIATVVHREVKRGFRRTPMKQIAITVPCDRTLRTIEMTVTGKNSDELDQIKQSLTNSRCH
ncbi:MAG: ABC transporter substrate-binding protein [Candidatus Caldarchaeum sp.]